MSNQKRFNVKEASEGINKLTKSIMNSVNENKNQRWQKNKCKKTKNIIQWVKGEQGQRSHDIILNVKRQDDYIPKHKGDQPPEKE